MSWLLMPSKVGDSCSKRSSLRSCACTAGIGLSIGTQKIGDIMKSGVVRAGAPFIGCVGAGWASLICMRYDELENGVYLKDSEGNQYGKSKAAASEGIAKCCAARVFWNIPILCGSPLPLPAKWSLNNLHLSSGSIQKPETKWTAPMKG